MPRSSKESLIQRFLKESKPYPILAGLLAGLYPVFFYATNNYTLVNTIGHVLYFIGIFLLVPMIGIGIAYWLGKKIHAGKFLKYIIPFSGSFNRIPNEGDGEAPVPASGRADEVKRSTPLPRPLPSKGKCGPLFMFMGELKLKITLTTHTNIQKS